MDLLAAPAPIRAWVNPGLGGVGCIGAPPDGLDPDEAIARAESWLYDQGCSAARGPLDGATWYTYRANLGPLGSRPPFLGEPTARPAPWLARGYRPVARYVSTLVDNQAQIQAQAERGRQLRAAGWRITTMAEPELADFDAALALFHRLSLVAFSEAFSYTPIDLGQFRALYLPLRERFDPRLVLVAISPAREPAGFCFAIPDLLNPGRHEFIVKTLAVLPPYRRLGVGGWLVAEAHRIAHRVGWTGGGIHALMWEKSHSPRIGRPAGATVIRRYALFERTLR